MRRFLFFLLSTSGIPKIVNIKKNTIKKKWPMSTQNMAKNLKKEKIKNTKIKITCVGWEGGGDYLHYLLCLISNTLPQLEQSSLHPQQFSVIASCYRPPATTISVFSYTSTAPEKENRSSNRLGNPLSQGVEKPLALQPITEIKSHACTRTHTHTHTHSAHVRAYACTYVCASMHTYGTHARMPTHGTCARMRTRACTRVHIYTEAYMCAHTPHLSIY